MAAQLMATKGPSARGLSACKRTREQLLAGAALAFDEHRRVARRRALQRERDLLQARIFADDLRRAAPLREFLLEQDVLGGQATLRERPLDEQQEVIGVDRLGQEVERAVLHGRDRVLDAAVRGHHDDRQVGVDLLRRAEDAEAVAVAEPQVRQHDAGPRRSAAPRRLPAGRAPR